MERTIRQVIETILGAIPGAPFPETVDTLKTGDPDGKVTRIAVTFLATYKVIEAAIQNGANLIITHEPTFYNHLDQTGWLKDDPVYQAKRRLIEDNHIAIWRFHDSLHSIQPDPTIVGLLKALGWSTYALPDHPLVCKLPPRPAHELVREMKSKLGISNVRVAGDMQMICRTVGFLVGAIGGRAHIKMFGEQSLDMLVCGEIDEWETNEYVRDAVSAGGARSLVIIGHSVSEEDGMREIVPWLQERLPGTPITFIPTGQALTTL
jgi:putative NIF3 family GTP cyclohydrolase 1 type 2